MDIESKSKYNFGFFVVLVVIIGYFQLFRLTIFPREIYVLSRFAAVIIIILFIIIKYVYIKGEELPKNFVLPINLILLSALISPIMAASYHSQPYFLSIWVSFGIFFYLFYFLLHSVKIEKKLLENIIISIGLITIVLFYVQFFLYPTRIYSDEVRMSLDRGTLRLFLPGMNFTIIAYFYYINKFFKTNQISFVVIAMFAFSIFILQATRQLIASIALLTILFIFRAKEIKSRLLIILLTSIGLVALFFSFYDLFTEMFLVTQFQATEQEDNIRIRAARYFLTDFIPNDLAYIFGNADGHQRSPYGMKLFILSTFNGYYLSDIGIVGDYVRYGAIFLVGAIIMLVRLIRIKVDPEFEYLRYYVYLMLLTMFTGGGDFGSPNILIILIAYLFDLGNYKLKINSS